MDEELTTGDGFADVVLDYSPAGNAPSGSPDEPYGTLIGDEGDPTEVTTDVVLGNDDQTALSLPTGSSITVGFTDEIVIDNPGDDIFVAEVGEARDQGEIFVSSSSNPGEQDFVSLGIGNGGTTSAFDLADIDFTEPVRAIKIVGLDNNGVFPGFDVISVQGLPESIASVDAAPIINTPDRKEVAGGEIDVIDINATDDNDEEGDGLTFAITGGANRNLFTVNPDNGQLAFKEAPTLDPEGENNFRVQVTVSDSDELTAVQNLRVNMEEELLGDGYADVVLDYSPAGNAPSGSPDEPYGSLTGSGEEPTEVTTDVVLGNDDQTFLSLPTDSSITVGFTDEIVIDNPGDDIFVAEAGPAGDQGEIFVSSSSNPGEEDFVSLGIGNGGTTSAFDLADIDFTEPVRAIKIVGLDNNGNHPGFDVVSVQGLPESIASVDAAPIINTPDRKEVAGGEIDVIDINATDDNDVEGDGLTFAITGGANRNLFTVNPDNGQLAFKEAPTLAPEGENNFRVQVTVSDSDELTAVQNLRVNLANEDEDQPRNPVAPNLVTEPLNTVTEFTGDRLIGTASRDLLLGNADSNILEGLRGNDALEGGAGDDQLDGGQGNDTAVYQGDEEGAIINLATDTATDGFADSDTLTSIENIIGSEFGDRLTGNTQDNQLTGGGGNDTISGGQGDDYLTGLGGVDVLTGNAGADNFAYVTPAEGSDRIEDFDGDSDTILIVGDTFSGDLSTGRLRESSNQFTLGTGATTANHRFVFNEDNGQLLFDQDGDGSANSQLLATFTGTPELTASDISIV